MFKEIRHGNRILKGLAQAVSDDYAARHGAELEHSGLFVTPFVNDELANVDRSLPENEGAPSEIPAQKFFVNYADEESLKKGAVIVGPDHNMVDEGGLQLDSSELDRRIGGKAVIIGSGTTVGDVFREPRTDAHLQGLYLLALAADTRIHAPLYEFQLWFRVVLHVLLGFLILMTVLGLRAYHIGHRRDLAASRVSLTLTFVVAGLTVVTGIFLVRATHVIWTDFFLAIFLLLLHPRIEHWIERFWHTLQRNVATLWAKFVFNNE
jgi:hypothetical protein